MSEISFGGEPGVRGVGDTGSCGGGGIVSSNQTEVINTKQYQERKMFKWAKAVVVVVY